MTDRPSTVTLADDDYDAERHTSNSGPLSCCAAMVVQWLDVLIDMPGLLDCIAIAASRSWCTCLAIVSLFK